MIPEGQLGPRGTASLLASFPSHETQVMLLPAPGGVHYQRHHGSDHACLLSLSGVCRRWAHDAL